LTLEVAAVHWLEEFHGLVLPEAKLKEWEIHFHFH